MQFDGTNSTDSDGTISQFVWNFNDASVPGGGTSTQPSPAFTFQNPGSYVVSLTVIDNEGDSDEETITIVVNTP